MGERFIAMDMIEAKNECNRTDQVTFTNCPKCRYRVGLHCSDCHLQVTGCLCTEIERFGNDEAWLRSVERFGLEFAKERFRMAGLWVPGDD